MSSDALTVIAEVTNTKVVDAKPETTLSNEDLMDQIENSTKKAEKLDPVSEAKRQLLDNWKRTYSNETEAQTLTEFEGIASQFTIWELKYNYNTDLPTADFMFRNFLNGQVQSLDETGLRKTNFAKVVGTYATWDGDSTIAKPASASIYLITLDPVMPSHFKATEFEDYYTWVQLPYGAETKIVVSNVTPDKDTMHVVVMK
jgi:hypothetical protein